MCYCYDGYVCPEHRPKQFDIAPALIVSKGNVYSLDTYRHFKKYSSKEDAIKASQIQSQDALDKHFLNIEQIKIENSNTIGKEIS